MKLYYDLHIHSALSPCGDNDMTPNNIVNMSILKGLDAIAVTDHNSCGNVRAVLKAAGNNLLVIPGMEIETAEEVHIVCYFKDIESAEKMQELVWESLPDIKNRPEIFGRQLYMNELDETVGEEERLLVNATTLDIYSVFENVQKLGGVAVPAHIDRTSYSIISNLGFIMPDLNITAVEITRKNLDKWKAEYDEYNIITNSDAHYLEDISERENCIEILGKTTKEILDFLCKKEFFEKN